MKMSTASAFLSVLMAAGLSAVSAARFITMPPITTNNTVDAAIIIVPGDNVTGQAYQALGQAIQQHTPLKLWVAVLTDFEGGVPTGWEVSQAVSGALSSLHTQGMSSSNLFLAGHGKGGQILPEYGLGQEGQSLKGVLLYGALLKRDIPLHTYPLPLLHLSGDLDGIARITRLVDTFMALGEIAEKNRSLMYTKPLVILPGVNHAQFASGHVPENIAYNDLSPEVTPQQAQQLIAKYTSAFLVKSLQVQGSDEVKAGKILTDAYTQTKAIMEPLVTLKGLEKNEANTDNWGISAQLQVAGLSHNTLNVTNKIIASKMELAFVKPSIEVSGGSKVAVVNTVSYVQDVFNPDDDWTLPCSPVYTAVKMKTREAIISAITSIRGIVRNITCKDINQAALQTAQSHASDLANQRFSSRGRQMVFKNDRYTSKGTEWLSAPLLLSEDNSSLSVTSPALRTSLHQSIIHSFNGMFYCKLLTPYRAAEWLYVDSLRTHVINNNRL